jgi:hypothetical protein
MNSKDILPKTLAVDLYRGYGLVSYGKREGLRLMSTSKDQRPLRSPE